MKFFNYVFKMLLMLVAGTFILSIVMEKSPIEIMLNSRWIAFCVGLLFIGIGGFLAGYESAIDTGKDKEEKESNDVGTKDNN